METDSQTPFATSIVCGAGRTYSAPVRSVVRLRAKTSVSGLAGRIRSYNSRMVVLVTAWLTFVTIAQVQPAAPHVPVDPKAHAAALIASMLAKDFPSIEAQFDDKMKAALPPGRMAATWNAILGQIGAFERCGTDVRVRNIADNTMVITPCAFARARLDVQLAFDAGNRISGFVLRPAAAPEAAYTPPAYANPSAYAEEDATVGSGEWALPGTLSLPTGPGPFPAVVLVGGSGPNDRDETIGPNKPLKDLASGLASRGIAVLRYDKRTKVHGAKLATVTDFTVKQEVVDDVLEAVRVLRANPKVDRARVFVLGHSLGGMLIPRIGAADPSLAGLVVMAGPARAIEDAVLAQTRYLALADGTVTPDEQARIDEAVALVTKVKALTPPDAKGAGNIFGAPASYWLDLRGYDAPSAAKGLKPPLLVLQGERDYQVTMAEFERWKASLAGRASVTFHSYPDLNHLFMAGTGKSVPSEYETPGHVAEPVVRDLAAWLLRPGPGSGL
jgi:uncharacterized protein